jgi:hypothetical protein
VTVKPPVGRVRNPSRLFSRPGGVGTTNGMADIVFVLIGIGFFALCAALVAGCDRIVRGEEQS